MATERPTYCRICVAGCGIVVSTEGDTVVGVRGNPEHVLSQGYTCPKGRAIPALHHHAGRLDRPVTRRGGAVVDATWDESLDDVATRVRRILDEHGPSAVGYFVGSGGYFDAAGLFTSNRLMRTLATPSYYSDTSIDVISTMVVSELVSGMPGLLAKPDLDENRMLIIVGSNPVVSHGQTLLMPNPIVRLRELAARGELWVLDPRRTETARLATGHLQGRAGTDHAIFGFLVRELLRDGADHEYLDHHATGVEDLTASVERFTRAHVAELSGVAETDLQRLLDAVRRAGRVAVLTGTGLSMADGREHRQLVHLGAGDHHALGRSARRRVVHPRVLHAVGPQRPPAVTADGHACPGPGESPGVELLARRVPVRSDGRRDRGRQPARAVRRRAETSRSTCPTIGDSPLRSPGSTSSSWPTSSPPRPRSSRPTCGPAPASWNGPTSR